MVDTTKRYGTLRALDSVSLSVAPGEVLGVLGRNGAGKPTLLRLLTGRARPTSGAVLVLGHELPRDLAHVRERINLVVILAWTAGGYAVLAHVATRREL